ncbi:MAG: thioredoxin family protein [Desulfobacterales bacterium]|nr:thioredoxin family protein [Desulfobacterales bacterium]
MVLTPSTMEELGSIAPDIDLTAPDGKRYLLAEQHIDNGLLVIFMCNHCPYVLHIIARLADKIRRYQEQGIAVVAINSNDASAYPDDSPEKMAHLAKEFNFSFPYLVDEKQELAKAYRAACTPDFFLYDADKKLVYRGQYDRARPGNNEPITGEDLSAAIDQLVAGKAISLEQSPSMGCNIKWVAGNEPGYFG